MSAFWTLIKREYLEHKVAMLWVPLILAALMAIVMMTGAFRIPPQFMQISTKNAEFKASGTLTINKSDMGDTKEEQEKNLRELQSLGIDGVTVDGDTVTIDVEKAKNAKQIPQVKSRIREKISKAGPVIPLAASMFSIPLLIIAGFVTIFMLLNSLYEERVDRSILFWKSMPVSDTKTVLAKFTALTGGTFAIAIGVGILLTLFGFLLFNLFPEFGLLREIAGSANSISGLFWIWISIFTALVMYILWMAPLYGWFTFVSAASPKAPFFFAFAPIIALVVTEAIMSKRIGLAEEIGVRAIGGHVFTTPGLKAMAEKGSDEYLLQNISHIPGALLQGLASPGLWIGLAITAALLYAAIEMRRRKAL
jgi:ABC-2 type transport system permease protein